VTREATLEDMDMRPLSGLETHIPDIQSFVHEKFLVAYGVRTDDDAMVFHFFAPPDSTWDESFQMVDRLNEVTGRYYPLDRYKVKGGYTPELDSYYVIVPGAGAAISPPIDRAEEYLSALGAYVPEGAS